MSEAHPSSALEECLQRLERLAGSDEGFYVLALHSFVESHVCETHPPLSWIEEFGKKMWAFGDFLKDERKVPVGELAVLSAIGREHWLTNKVRHSFVRLDREEVLAATHNFLRFCRLCGIDSPALERLRASLADWDERRSPLAASAELRRAQAALLEAQSDNRRLMTRLACFERDAARAEELAGKLKVLDAEIVHERERADRSEERVAGLRAALEQARGERMQLLRRLQGYCDIEGYLDHLCRFTIYTRTRRDYERSVMRLTTEQREAVEAMAAGRDVLVRGGAGTGKTIVLLRAFERARQDRDAELAFGRPARLALLTYTTTLVKYDRWLAGILRAAGDDDLIATADSFFLARLKRLDERWNVDYRAARRLAAAYNTTEFLTNEELAAELEDFLLANAASREEYVEDRVPRRGMRQPLGVVQRGQVWGIRQRVVEEMERTGIFSKNWSRMKLIEHLERTPDDPALCDIDIAFVDEAQDLAPVDLKALKLLSRRGIVLAGDTGQAIYGIGSPYRRAGVDIAGRSRVLRTSFRTTCPILELAERYRRAGGAPADDPPPDAFREGPLPEMHQAPSRDELCRLVIAKAALYVGTLGYDPENVTVLAPTRSDLSLVGQFLAKAGRPAVDIRDDAFSFEQAGSIRLSTLHSSKGLDFPVVLLFLPGLPAAGEHDERSADALTRNLIYVALTRAMDNLAIFLLERPAEQAIADLASVYETWRLERTAQSHMTSP